MPLNLDERNSANGSNGSKSVLRKLVYDYDDLDARNDDRGDSADDDGIYARDAHSQDYCHCCDRREHESLPESAFRGTIPPCIFRSPHRESTRPARRRDSQDRYPTLRYVRLLTKLDSEL